jgi:hypothetical protein
MFSKHLWGCVMAELPWVCAGSGRGQGLSELWLLWSKGTTIEAVFIIAVLTDAFPGSLQSLQVTSGNKNKQTPWPESASELCRPSDRRLSAKLVPNFADRGCHVVSVTDPYGRNLGFLDRDCYVFFQLYSRGLMDPVNFRYDSPVETRNFFCQTVTRPFVGLKLLTSSFIK